MGLAVEDVRDDVFHPPPPTQARPVVCTHHPSFPTRIVTGLHPLTVQAGQIVVWNRPDKPEVVKEACCDGDVHVMWAAGGILPPTREASCWQPINEAPPFMHTKEGKLGGWTIWCPCECEVCVAWHEYPPVPKVCDFQAQASNCPPPYPQAGLRGAILAPCEYTQKQGMNSAPRGRLAPVGKNEYLYLSKMLFSCNHTAVVKTQ